MITAAAVSPADVPLSVNQILTVGGALLAVAVYLLYKLGHYMARVLEALATAAVVFLALWFAAKGLVLAAVWAVRHWRTTTTVTVVSAWCWWWGWLSLLLALAVLAAGLGCGGSCRYPRSIAGPGGTSGRGGSAGWSTPHGCHAGCVPAA